MGWLGRLAGRHTRLVVAASTVSLALSMLDALPASVRIPLFYTGTLLLALLSLSN